MFLIIICVVISITTFSITKNPRKNLKKNRTEPWQHYSLRIVNEKLNIHFRPTNIPGSEVPFQQARHAIIKVVDVIFPEPREGPFMDAARQEFDGLLRAITEVCPFTISFR